MTAPLVTVVIPVLNRDRQIGPAIESVVRQTFGDWKLIVVDDHSRDETPAVVAQWSARDPRISLLRHETTRGAQAARNTGIRAADSEWIAFLDSDDVYYPNSLADRLDCARACGCVVVHSAGHIWEKGAAAPVFVDLPPVTGRCYRDLLSRLGPMFQSLLVKRAALQEIGLLDEAIISNQEWDTGIRLARRFRFAYVPAPTYLYNRRRTDGFFDNWARYAAGYEQIVRKHRWAMLLHGGFPMLARHYRKLMDLYYHADMETEAHRCARRADLLSPLQAIRRRRSSGP